MIVSGDRLDSLASLEPVAEAIFGAGQRRPGWFARKLERECVDPRSCSLLLREGVDPLAPVRAEQVGGYVLLGRPPSFNTLARGAGVGVLPELRGRGHAAALLEASLARAARVEVQAVELLAEPALLDWYLRLGFEAVRSEWTLLADATGTAAASLAWNAQASPVDPAELCIWEWSPEAWQRTPAAERARLELDSGSVCGHAWITREGRAYLIQRLALTGPGRSREPALLAALLEQLRACLPAGAPVLLYPIPAQACWSNALCDAGWRVAQRSWVVRCPVSRGLYKRPTSGGA